VVWDLGVWRLCGWERDSVRNIAFGVGEGRKISEDDENWRLRGRCRVLLLSPMGPYITTLREEEEVAFLPSLSSRD